MRGAFRITSNYSAKLATRLHGSADTASGGIPVCVCAHGGSNHDVSAHRRGMFGPYNVALRYRYPVNLMHGTTFADEDVGLKAVSDAVWVIQAVANNALHQRVEGGQDTGNTLEGLKSHLVGGRRSHLVEM